MTFSGQNNDIAGLSVKDGITDGLLTVCDLDVFSICLFAFPVSISFRISSGFSKRGLSEVMIVKSASLPETSAHLKAAGFGTVSATAKEADQSARLVLFQGSKKALQAHRVMSIIDH